MCKGRFIEAQEPMEIDLACAGPEEVSSPYDLGDAHESIVHDDGELIGKDAIAAPDEKITAVTGKHFMLLAVYKVLEGYGTTWAVCGRNTQSQGSRSRLRTSEHLFGAQVSTGTSIDVGSI
jgi:hypothetical protein